jgi:tripartite-type tricarboxylate transporter receptor subunit TctC
MHSIISIRSFVLLALISLTLGHEATAQTPAEFYKGKTVRIVAGFPPGGGYDSYSRLLARNFGRFIPGNPDVIVNNMPGAGGTKAVLYLDSGGAKDGTYVSALDPGLIVQSILEPEKYAIDAAKYAWLGSISEDARGCYVWAQTGIKTLDDLIKREQVIFGEAGKGSAAYVNERILQVVFGVKVKQIIGYPGGADKRLAMERGEIEGDCGSFSSIPPDYFREGKINVVVRFSQHVGVKMAVEPPYAIDIVKDPQQKELLQFLISSGNVGRPYIASKDVPQDRLDAMKKAFEQVIKDPQFKGDAEKANLPLIGPKNGDETQSIIAELYKTPADIVEQAKKISED